ncbi:MAG: phosphoglycerate dehydrogenase [Dysosmobacter sp.]|uniref:phosphoglycerate dehydrogenase n=1 Tax=Pseudoflavonifractor capillosus TaxID=106588 RepID=UPI002A7F8B6E|nr:phosphoglycerate dehydrogenase [Pseudoflavonifractor capillosus]MDY3692004.1 phosphoglycerate dehydrogenase [Dysosmobacter sp.]MDY4660165.1 phosphoglycerate dehydrogenase [Pseudoflavonifractor capillosus]
MYRIKTFNKISPVGLNRFDPALYSVSESESSEDGILVRSAKLQDYEFPANLLGISRAGVGVNNIPLDRCSQAGIAVFNTPGANANAVKELVVCAMLIGSRDVDGAIQWVRQQVASGVDVTTVVEKGKSAFLGPEIYKKTLGVIGLGAIGSLVANLALDLGMDVYGYDPFLSVDSALRLDRHIHVVQDINELYKRADYITIHIHFTPKTEKMIDEKAIANMKRGVRFINLARGEIVDDDAMLAALDTGKVAAYVTDFPNNRIVQAPHVIAMPHLGASTPESEQNCAVMAVDQLRDYLENGNIRNSVNLPNVTLERSGVMRMCIIHKNIPAMLANITTLLATDGVNVENLSNKSKGDYAYTLVDLGSKVGQTVINDVTHLPNVIRVRVIE